MSTGSKPLLSANWFRVAAVRPRLRGHVRITRQHFRGDRWFVLEDLVENSVHRFAPAARQAIGMMDGSHTLDEIWTALGELGEERPTQDEMIHLLAQLDGANLLATERLPDFAELSDRAQRVTARKLWRRLANPLYLRIPLCDPDRFLDATVGLVRPLASVWGLALWLVVVGWGVGLAVLHWGALTNDLADRVLARDNILILAVTFPVLKLLHELGHCYCAKIFGASVHEAGIMTLVRDAGAVCRCQRRQRLQQQMAARAGGRRRNADRAVLRRPRHAGLGERGAGTGACRGVQLPADRRRLHAVVQRQPAAAVRRLFHPVGPDRDSQSRCACDALLWLPGEPLRLRRACLPVAGPGARRGGLVPVLRRSLGTPIGSG